MYSEILAQLKTVDDVDILIQEIDILVNSLYKSSFEEILYSKVRSSMIRLLPRDGESLSKLLKLLKTLKLLKLTLAVSPTPALVDTISAWVKTNIGEDVVLDLDLDSTLIGGAQIAFAGKYADYSLSSAYDQFCQTAK